MGTFVLLIVGTLLCMMLYRRYFPVFGIPCRKSGNDTSTVTLDIRDYNVDMDQQTSDMRIPYAYLRRFIREIPKKRLHVIAYDRLELNLGIRYLVNRGYQVASYQISECPCRRNK